MLNSRRRRYFNTSRHGYSFYLGADSYSGLLAIREQSQIDINVEFKAYADVLSDIYPKVERTVIRTTVIWDIGLVNLGRVS